LEDQGFYCLLDDWALKCSDYASMVKTVWKEKSWNVTLDHIWVHYFCPVQYTTESAECDHQ
jgi:hypothetical protein